MQSEGCILDAPHRRRVTGVYIYVGCQNVPLRGLGVLYILCRVSEGLALVLHAADVSQVCVYV